MTKLIISLIPLSFLLICCSGESTNTEVQKNFEKTSVKSKTQEKSCLEQYYGEPWKIFTNEEVAKLVDLPVDAVKVKDPFMTKTLSSRAYGYKWDTDRMLTVKVGKNEMTVPAQDNVVIGRLHILDPEKVRESFLADFNNSYRHVLHKNMTFTIVVELSDDSDYNLEKAKKIAQAILDKCD